MLKSLDILIGLVVVLLALSMAVTLITQAAISVVNSRGRHLRQGLADLLQQLDPGLDAKISSAVATAILTHPLVSGSKTFISTGDANATGFMAGLRGFLGGRRYGNVVHREEFTKLLFALASGDGTQKLGDSAQKALVEALAANGISDPATRLKNIRTVALQLERSNPELAHPVRQNIAMLQEAGSDLVAKINGWFDQTMDRTSQRFTASTRAITFVASCLVAFGLQVDTPLLVNRLAADDVLREALVADAKRITAPTPTTTTTTTAKPTSPEKPPATEFKEYRAFLAANGLITLPTVNDWPEQFKKADKLGIIVTALLLSLGAPFWYSALSRLLQLRSVLAVKDDSQRQARQTTEAGGGPSTTSITQATVPAGERGDLTAIGVTRS